MGTFSDHAPVSGNQVPEFRVVAGSTAMMIIDMQKMDASRTDGLFGRRAIENGTTDVWSYYFDRLENVVVPNIASVIAKCRATGVPVIHVRVCDLSPDQSDTSQRYRHFGLIITPDSEDAEFVPGCEPLPGEMVVNKTTSSVFNSTDIKSVLNSMGIDTLIMCGVVTNGCVESSTRSAGDLNFKVLLLEDGCATMTEERHQASLKQMHRNFAYVTTTESVLGQLDEAAAGLAVSA